jgi:hypothetical protein
VVSNVAYLQGLPWLKEAASLFTASALIAILCVVAPPAVRTVIDNF